MGHILVASLISAPAALLVAGVMIPETDAHRDADVAPLVRQSQSAMDAVTRGTLEAIPLMLNVMAMLVVLVALVTLANQMLGLLPQVAGEPADPPAPPRLGHGPGGLVDRHPLGRGPDRRGPDGGQDGAQRVRRLPATWPASPRVP